MSGQNWYYVAKLVVRHLEIDILHMMHYSSRYVVHNFTGQYGVWIAIKEVKQTVLYSTTSSTVFVLPRQLLTQNLSV
jgi:hypothetical protein